MGDDDSDSEHAIAHVCSASWSFGRGRTDSWGQYLATVPEQMNGFAADRRGSVQSPRPSMLFGILSLNFEREVGDFGNSFNLLLRVDPLPG